MSDNPQTPKKPKKTVALGKPLQLSDEDLERLSEITPEDIENAKAAVNRASPKLGAMLDSQTEEDENNG